MFTILLLFLITSATKCTGNENLSVLDKLQSGLQLAGKFLNSNRSKGVAYLVTEAFEKSRTKAKDDDNQSNIFSALLRVLGFDTKKIGAITVNAIIFVAQLISSAVHLKRPVEVANDGETKTGSLFDWMMRSIGTSNLLEDVANDQLPEQVIEYVKERSLDEDTGCIQLLICKSIPFIKQMQESFKQRNNSLGYKALYEYLPTVDDVSDNGDACEQAYPYCTIPL